MKILRLALVVLTASFLVAAPAAAIQLIMPVDSQYDLDGDGTVDISYFKSGSCGPSTGILNGAMFAEAFDQGAEFTWEEQTYTFARTASYNGGGGFTWSAPYFENIPTHVAYIVRTGAHQQYYKVRAIAFDPAFPCNSFDDPPPYAGDVSMTLELEELPVFLNRFETSDIEDWSSGLP